MIDCLRPLPVSTLLTAAIDVPEHLTAFGPIIDSIVVPVDPRKVYHAQLYSQLVLSKLSDSAVTSDLSQLTSLLDHAMGRSYDLLLGATSCDVPCIFSQSELKDGLRPSRRDRIIKTLVRNLFDYHQQVWHLMEI